MRMISCGIAAAIMAACAPTKIASPLTPIEDASLQGGAIGPARSVEGLPPDGLLLAFSAQEDAGTCEWTRTDTADVGPLGFRIYRGEARYIQPSGVTTLPFQALMKFAGEDGIASDHSQFRLPHRGPCSQLAIEIVVTHCEVRTDLGRRKEECPGEIRMTGTDAFKSIALERADRERTR